MGAVIEALIQTFITSGIIWAATTAFKRCFRQKLSPKAHLAVWAVLIVRLLVPVTFDTGIHLIEIPTAYSVQQNVPAESQDAGVSAAASYTSFKITQESMTETSSSPVGVVAPVLPEGPDRDAVSAIHWDAEPDEIAFGIWILGILVSAALSVHAYSTLKKDVAARMCGGADPLHLLFQECMSELGIRERVFLAVQSELAGPALMFPNVVLLKEDMQHMSPEAVRMALRHELMHFARRDHVKALVLSVLRTVWWFNPFVWLAVRQIREDIETACDSDVVGQLEKGGREAYAKTVLSMFGRTETNQAVLGMAFGGAKKNAERRIRGIYMKRKSRCGAKACALALCGVLAAACFTTACQPTPAAEAVVNQKEGVPEDALKGESTTVDPQAPAEPMAEYSSLERWDETLDLADNFTVKADLDVLVPDVSAYPVEKLAPREITQEMADRLIAYFAPDAEFFQTAETATKSYWEERIVELRETLAMDQERGDADAVEQDQAAIDEMTEMYENAPEVSERVPATTEFSFAVDELTGEPYEDLGPNIIAISTESTDGSRKQFDVRRRIENDPAQFPMFSYTNASYQVESMDEGMQSSADGALSDAESLEEPYRSQELERQQKQQSAMERRLALYDQNPMSETAARSRALEVLRELDIPSVQIVHCERALLGPYTGYYDSAYGDGTPEDLSEPGMYLEFQRENGGIPCMLPNSQIYMPGSEEKQYSAPFTPERGSIVLDKEGTVRCFMWESPTQAVEIVAPDSELIPLSEAKDRLVQRLYQTELGISSEYLEDNSMQYTIEDMRLVMGYAGIPNDPDNALAIPAWYMTAQGSSVLQGDEEAVMLNEQELMISALDGAPVLMAGTTAG